MRNSIQILTMACVFLLVAMMPAGAREAPGEASAWLRARIALDANGKLEAIQWLDAKAGDRMITSRLEEVVRGWEFEPGSVNGVPVATETGLIMHVTVKPNPQGGMAVSIGRANTGAISQLQAPPRYPIDAARQGSQAMLKLLLDTDENGKVVSAKVSDYVGNSKSKFARKDFEAAAMEAAKSWTFHTEQVAGKGQPASMRVPISFCMSDWCARKEAELSAKATLATEAPTGMAVALDSAVKIKTRTTQVDIRS